MSDQNAWELAGRIIAVKDGHFENQKKVTIKRDDGEGDFEAQWNQKKKDGTDTKVGPLIKKSYMDGPSYTWSGNYKTVDAQDGSKRNYYTINWGFEVKPEDNVTAVEWEYKEEDPGPEQVGRPLREPGFDASQTATEVGDVNTSVATEAAVQQVTEKLGGEVVEIRRGNLPPLTPEDTAWAKTTAPNFDATTKQIEAAWALGVMANAGFRADEEDKIVEQAILLVQRKRRIASEL